MSANTSDASVTFDNSYVSLWIVHIRMAVQNQSEAVGEFVVRLPYYFSHRSILLKICSVET